MCLLPKPSVLESSPTSRAVKRDQLVAEQRGPTRFCVCGVFNVQSQKLPGRTALRFYQVTHGHYYQEVFGDSVLTKVVRDSYI